MPSSSVANLLMVRELVRLGMDTIGPDSNDTRDLLSARIDDLTRDPDELAMTAVSLAVVAGHMLSMYAARVADVLDGTDPVLRRYRAAGLEPSMADLNLTPERFMQDYNLSLALLAEEQG